MHECRSRHFTFACWLRGKSFNVDGIPNYRFYIVHCKYGNFVLDSMDFRLISKSTAPRYDSLRQYPSFTLMINKELDAFRLLEQETKTSFKDIDFACEDILESFKRINTDGIPDFSSEFSKELINEIPVKTFNDLIQISGLSHGTDVWLDEVKELVKNGLSVSNIIAYRDDVFNYLQNKLKTTGISNTGYAYKIMEDTRRGIYARGGVSDEMKQQFVSLEIEDWFLNSIEKIRYLFPKSHGALFVKYALILM